MRQLAAEVALSDGVFCINSRWMPPDENRDLPGQLQRKPVADAAAQAIAEGVRELWPDAEVVPAAGRRRRRHRWMRWSAPLAASCCATPCAARWAPVDARFAVLGDGETA